jgi:ATP-dependent exoDNAse (exonuclease V) beta subunit
MVGYLGLVVNPHDDVAFLRVVNVPPRGVGAATLQKLELQAKEDKCSLFTAALRSLGEKYGQLVRMIQTLRQPTSKPVKPHEVLARIIHETQYQVYLKKKHPSDAEQRFENLGELATVLSQSRFRSSVNVDMNRNPTLAALSAALEEVTLMVAASKAQSDATSRVEAVTLSTYHAAKGLEYEMVFLPCLEENILPYYQALKSDGGPEKQKERLEEERRLLFVGMTRAKSVLTLSHCSHREKFGKTEAMSPSRFLQLIPKKLLSDKLDSEAIDRLFAEFLPLSNKPVPVRTLSVSMSEVRNKEVAAAAAAVNAKDVEKPASLLSRLLEALQPDKAHKAEEKKKSCKRRKKEEVKEEPEEVVRCECGVTEDDGQLFIACDTCGVWSHASCHGFTADTVPDVWHCCL